MAELNVLPNVLALVVAFLKADPDVAALVGSRIEAVNLTTETRPCVRVTRYGGMPAVGGAWQPAPILLDTANLQIDVWGRTNKEAGDTAALLRAALGQRLPGTHNVAGITGTVTRVQFGTYADDPDDVYDPPWPRVRFDTTITYKP